MKFPLKRTSFPELRIKYSLYSMYDVYKLLNMEAP